MTFVMLLPFSEFYLHQNPERNPAKYQATQPPLDLSMKGDDLTTVSVNSKESCAYRCLWDGDDVQGKKCVGFLYRHVQTQAHCLLVYDTN